MLFHHSPRSYEEAATEAAQVARTRLDALIEKGRQRGAAVLAQVEATQPHDQLVSASELYFAPDPAVASRMLVHPGSTATPRLLHPFALGQAADRAGLPRSYLSRLLDAENATWGPELAAENLNRLYRGGLVANDNDDAVADAYLLRAVPVGDGAQEVRGFLSSRFKRIDSRPVFAAFADACARVGALPVEGYATDTKVALKAVLGRVFEPVPHEVLAYGLLLENSDFGNGALQCSFFMLRLWCTNYAIAESALRKVHLGSRLTPGVAWSARTITMETEATASAVHDLVVGRLNERHVAVLGEGIRRAHEEKVDATKVGEFLKRHLLKAEVEAVAAAFNSAEVEMLPPGQTRWRLSNAISWIAGKTEDAERRLELMKVAGTVVPVPEVA